MKSTHEPFDDELNDRLRQYTEEPDGDIWKRIAPQIVSVKSETGWLVWSQRISAIVLGAMIMFEITQPEDSIESTLPVSNGTEQVQREDKVAAEITDAGENLNDPVRPHPEGHVTANDAATSISRPATTADDMIVTKDEQRLNEPAGSMISMNALQDNSVDSIINDTVIVATEKAIERDTLEEEQISNDKRNLRRRNATLFLTAMPVLGYQRIESNRTDNIFIESIQQEATFSHKRLGIRVELGMEYRLTKKLRLFGGLLYYQRHQTIEYIEKQLDSTTVASGPNGESIIEPQFSYPNKSVEYELKNAGFQIGFNYRLSKFKSTHDSETALSSETIPLPRKKFLHLVGAGIEFQKSLSKTNALDQASGFTYPSGYALINAYYRLQYPNEGRLKAILQPTLNYAFNINENPNAPFYVRPYGFGLNLGCTYDF
jgi:hypothetical protein